MNNDEQKKQARRSARHINKRGSSTSGNSVSPGDQAASSPTAPSTSPSADENILTKRSRGKGKGKSGKTADADMIDERSVDEERQRDADLFSGVQRGRSTSGTMGPPPPPGRRARGEPTSPDTMPFSDIMGSTSPSSAASTSSTNTKKKLVIKPPKDPERTQPYDPSRPMRVQEYGTNFMQYYVTGGDEDYEAAGGDARYHPEYVAEGEVEEEEKKGRKGKGKGKEKE